MIYIKGKKVIIIGAGRSGLAAAELLVSKAALVHIFDNDLRFNENTGLRNELDLKGISYEFRTGPANDENWDFCILSPGIPQSAPVLDEIREKVPLVSEIELAFWFSNGPVIAVTGSNGKSTVTRLIENMLENSGQHAVACGNIGHSFSRAVLENAVERDGPVYVVEVSSFQLEHIALFSPQTSIILNITPDHLDRYPTFSDYRNAKLNILEKQSHIQRAVLNMDDLEIRDYHRTKARIIPVSMEHVKDQLCWIKGEELLIEINAEIFSIPLRDILLPGPHNLYNIMHAVSAVIPFVQSSEGILKTLREFRGIEHRIEYCGEIQGASCYNDSKATNLDSVTAAVSSFPANIHLILGGRDKNGDFTVLKRFSERFAAIYLIGEAADKIGQQLEDIPKKYCGNMENAVNFAAEVLKTGDVLLLSPGCSSFDQYENFDERGKDFKKLLEKYR